MKSEMTQSADYAKKMLKIIQNLHMIQFSYNTKHPLFNSERKITWKDKKRKRSVKLEGKKTFLNMDAIINKDIKQEEKIENGLKLN